MPEKEPTIQKITWEYVKRIEERLCKCLVFMFVKLVTGERKIIQGGDTSCEISNADQILIRVQEALQNVNRLYGNVNGSSYELEQYHQFLSRRITSVVMRFDHRGEIIEYKNYMQAKLHQILFLLMFQSYLEKHGAKDFSIIRVLINDLYDSGYSKVIYSSKCAGEFYARLDISSFELSSRQLGLDDAIDIGELQNTLQLNPHQLVMLYDSIFTDQEQTQVASKPQPAEV